MRSGLLMVAFFLNLLCLEAQTIKELNKAAQSNSGKKNQNTNSYSRGSNDGLAAFMLLRSLFWMGQGMGNLAREEARLARRNREENHLYCLDIRPPAENLKHWDSCAG